MRNEPAATFHSEMPPGKYSLPVMPFMTSAAARLNVLCPEMYPWNDGVTNVGSWYGIHVVPRIHPTSAAPGGPAVRCHARMAILPSLPPSVSIGPPLAVLSFVMSSMSPGTSGSPCLLYAGSDGSVD